MSAKDEAIKDTQQKIKDLQKYIQVLKELPDPPENFSFFISDRGRVFVDLPYDFEVYRLYRQQLGKAGWVATMVYSVSENGKRFTDMIDSNGQRLSLVMNPEIEGATCELVKIGEEVKPVYKVQCR